MDKQPPHRIATIVAVIIFGGASLGATMLGLQRLSRLLAQRQTSTWVAADGTIVRSEVHRTQSHSGRGTSITWTPEVHARYETPAGNESVATLMLFPFDQGSKLRADYFVNEHDVGAPVTVFYNPENPDQAILLTGSVGIPAKEWTTVIVLGFAATFLGLVVLFIVVTNVRAK